MIYIACLPYFATGGTELLHQFAAELISNGVSSKILYHNAKAYPVAERFKKYKVPYVTDLSGIQNNDVLIVPEILTDLLYERRDIKKIIWWLSVDFFYRSRFSKRNLFRKIILQKNFYNFNDEDVKHYVQSRYAYDFLVSKKIMPNGFLSDYLGEDFILNAISASQNKRNPFVVYNPQKGIKFTKKLIAECPDINFIPIENMTPAAVSQLLSTSTLYIDFGNHPGKDRIPREAAISGCCLIVGRRGAAINPEDIPISENLKFDFSRMGLSKASKKIKEIIINPDSYALMLNNYIKQIKAERLIFKSQVIDFIKDNKLS